MWFDDSKKCRDQKILCKGDVIIITMKRIHILKYERTETISVTHNLLLHFFLTIKDADKTLTFTRRKKRNHGHKQVTKSRKKNPNNNQYLATLQNTLTTKERG